MDTTSDRGTAMPGASNASSGTQRVTVEEDPLISYILGEFSEEELESLDPEILKHILNDVSTKSAKRLLRELNKRRAALIKQQTTFRSQFERRLYRLWGTALDKLEMLIVCSSEAGDEFAQWYYPEATRRNDLVFDAVVRLHVRAIQTAREVLVLLRSGYAAGAHARWRTIHELAVVAEFVAKHGNATAERYLLHEYVDSYKGMLQYQSHHVQLGLDPLSPGEIEAIEKHKVAVVQRFGPDFSSDYGWAAITLKKKRPNFADIEEAVGLAHFRPWYRMSSHPVHAGSKGIRFNLGIMPDAESFLAGASNGGLADPGQSTAISLGQITLTLITHEMRPDQLPVMRMLSLLVDEVRDAFLRAHWRWVKKTEANLEK